MSARIGMIEHLSPGTWNADGTLTITLVSASRAGVEIRTLESFTLDPIQARNLAALLVRGADETERMRERQASDISIEDRQRKLHDIVATIRTHLTAYVREHFRDAVIVAERADQHSIRVGSVVAIGHVFWMCNEVDEHIRAQRFDKANRWIGFMQGVQWLYADVSIDQSRRINKDG